MAEATLTIDLSYLRIVAAEIMYGGEGDYSVLKSHEQQRVDRTLQSGLREFYGKWNWSFLRPIQTLTLNAPYVTGTVTVAAGVVTLAGGTWPTWAAAGVLLVNGIDYTVNTRDSGTQLTLDDLSVTASAGTTFELHQDDYDLPDDFDYMIGSKFTFANPDNASWDINLVSEQRIRQLRQYDYVGPSSTADPVLAAVRQKNFDQTLGQRYEIMFWPRVSATATITYRMHVRPSMLTSTNKYPYGASQHSETIVAAVEAAAELATDEIAGVKAQKFMRL